MNLPELREQIDEVDAQLIALFTRRMEIAAQIAQYKRENQLPVLDASREQAKLDAVRAQSPETVREYTPELFRTLFALSKRYQNRLLDAEHEHGDR